MFHKKPGFKEKNYYQKIVNLANVAIVKFDKNFILTDFTGNSEIIFGFKKEEVVGKSLYKTIVPQFDSTGRDLEKLMTRITDNIKSYEYNVNENITKDGKRIWMQWYNSEITGERNELSGVLSIGIDVTDRIQAENALRESEERFKKLSDLTFEGILIHDQGIIIDCNLSFERQTGYSRKELIGMQLLDKLIPQEFHQIMRSNMIADSVQYEAEAIHRNGTRFPISIESRSTSIGNKSVRVAAVRNISEWKKTINELDKYKSRLEELVRQRTAELKLQSKKLKNQNDTLQFERNQLRTIIDHIPDLIYIKDSESRFLNANLRQIHHLKCKKLSDILGKTDFDFYSRQYADKYFADEKEIIETGKIINNEEEPSVNEFGDQIYLSTTKVPLRDERGRIIGIVGVGKDITEKIIAENKLHDFNKKLEYANHILQEQKEELVTTIEQLKKAQSHLVQSEKMASLGILLAGIAHEINNPVNFIYAGINSIIKDFDDVEIVIKSFDALDIKQPDTIPVLKKIEDLKKEYEFDMAYTAITETLQDIKLGATRIKELVDGLSRFSRLETESWKKADIHEEIDNVLVLLKNKYKHHIDIVKNYDPSLPPIECFPGKLYQVFMNIINNAIDAIEKEHGAITIKTSFASGLATISIEDTGRGIKEEDRLKIFDPFFTTKDVGFGLGLGLSICYSIIQEHNGEITVKSVLDQGTEFIIRIPVIQTKVN